MDHEKTQLYRAIIRSLKVLASLLEKIVKGEKV